MWLCVSNQKGELHILFLLLASMFAHHSGQSLYIAREGWDRKNFHWLTFRERKFLLFGWQRTPLLGLSLAYQTLRNDNTWVHLLCLTNDLSRSRMAAKSTVTRISEFAAYTCFCSFVRCGESKSTLLVFDWARFLFASQRFERLLLDFIGRWGWLAV